MAKVLFTHSYFYQFDPKQWADKRPYPPYGTIYAAAHLRENNHEVALFDVCLKPNINELDAILEKEQPSYLVIYDDGFNYLTKMCLTNMREAAFEMAKKAKAKGCKIIACSSDSTDHYEQYLENGVDFVILGEGEIGLLELVNKIEANETDFIQVRGIAYKDKEATVRTGARPVLRDLDSLPMPAWDLINIDEYRKIWVDNNGYFSLNLATTRGCPYKCNWCAKPIYGNGYNMRSPERVADEIEYVLEHLKPDHFWVCDDIFGLKVRWLQEFRDEVVARKLKFKYKIQSRVDLMMKERYIDMLAESGLDEAWVGAESGSQKILDAMDKGTKVEHIYEATKQLKQKGIKACFFLQFGYIGETKEDIAKTIQMVKDLVPDNIGISVSYPLPGTPFYDKVQSTMKGKFNWTDSDELAMMYQSTFNTAYYKRLHRYVHKVFRRKQGWESIKKTLKNPFKTSGWQLRSALATFYYIPTSIIDGFKLKGLENYN